MKTFGLVGYPLGHSFSKKFFTEKFKNDSLNDHQYLNFEIDSIELFPAIFDQYDNIGGLNCTIPYKQQIMTFLNEIDDEARAVGAVNTVKILQTPQGMRLKGFNTDVIGFERSIKPMLGSIHQKAIILGTGGASKAIKYVMKKLGIEYVSASIENELFENEIRYSDITTQIIADRKIIINATPLGTFPNINTCPQIPYEAITAQHVMFDLVYNPDITLFLQKGIEHGAKVKNGLEMLHGQAIAAWEIWNR
ncbi:MAG TPA: shikimate dehydrogenase [Prolixibacteraceae bacterium]|nr:shikimate dehydrogenase [Prolixibacteraceae bacterium]